MARISLSDLRQQALRRWAFVGGRWQPVGGKADTAAPPATGGSTTTTTTVAPTATGEDVWKTYSAAIPGAVLPLGAEVKTPLGAVAYPAFPPKSVTLSYTVPVNQDIYSDIAGYTVTERPSAGKAETFATFDPWRMQSPGAVPFSGWPRNGVGAITMTDVWVGPGAADRGDVVYQANKFVWVEDLVAAAPAGTYDFTDSKLGKGYDLRKLVTAASEVGKGRGVWVILVLAKALHFTPDFLDGFHNGVRIGSNTNGNVQVCGIVGQGPDSRVAPSADFLPSTSLTIDGTSVTQLDMMKDTNPRPSNYASVICVNGVPERVWLSNFSGLFNDLRASDGAKLYWNAIKIEGNNYGTLVERLSTRGFGHGYKDYNPGETDTVTWVGSQNGTERDLFLDGRSLDGVRRTTSPLGHNSAHNIRQERIAIQYMYAGMNTFWKCDGATLAFVDSYSTAVGGGAGINGSGINWEESYGRCRMYFVKATTLGKYSVDTTNADKTMNSAFWLGIESNLKDNAIDMLIWEPQWVRDDYQGVDANRRLVISMYMNYQNTTDSSTAITHPLMRLNGAWVKGGDNVDMNKMLVTATNPTRSRAYKTMPATAGFGVVR